jgi:CheY-like chemotaxis protein
VRPRRPTGAKSEFLSRVSHELRTPLNAILGFAQLMEMDRRPPLAPQQAQWNTQLQKAGWHLLRMIDDVLDFARIDTGHLRLKMAALDVGPVLAEARSLIAQAAAQRGLTVAESVGPQAGRMLGDATRVKQILTNLLSNAVKYNVPGGSIHIAVRAQGEALLSISVQDTGLGMTPQQLDHLFQPFNRLGREASTVEGNGIGLVIARRLAELMGGSLSAASAPGAGSTFPLLLPRAADDAPREAEPQPACAREAAYPVRSVHYIEDNEVNAEVMRGILTQRPQVTLAVSATGREGLAAIRRDLPSLVLLDMNLPDMEGLQVLDELRRLPATAGIPVLVVSADTTAELVAAATEAGATHVLGKPVNVLELLQVLDGCLEGRSATSV